MVGNERNTDSTGDEMVGSSPGAPSGRGDGGMSLSRRTALGLLGVAGFGLGTAGTASAQQVPREALSVSLRESLELRQSSGRALTFDEVAFDDGNNYNAETGQYTVQRSGRYRVDAGAEFRLPSVEGAGAKLLVRTNSSPQAMGVATGDTAVHGTATVSKLLEVEAGESIDVFVSYSSVAPSKPAVVVGRFQPLTFLTIDRVG